MAQYVEDDLDLCRSQHDDLVASFFSSSNTLQKIPVPDLQPLTGDRFQPRPSRQTPTRVSVSLAQLDKSEDQNEDNIEVAPSTSGDGSRSSSMSSMANDCGGIPFRKFLEVMTGPGLRVRKHKKIGNGKATVRVLRYSPGEDCVYWNSQILFVSNIHKVPIAEIKRVEILPNKMVVVTCSSKKKIPLVFEVSKEDAANVLHAGLEKLRELMVNRQNALT